MARKIFLVAAQKFFLKKSVDKGEKSAIMQIIQ